MRLLNNRKLFIAVTLICVLICAVSHVSADVSPGGPGPAANPSAAPHGPGPAKSGGAGGPKVVAGTVSGEQPSLLWRILLYQGGANEHGTLYNAFHGPLCLTILAILFLGMISAGCAGVGKAGGAV